MVEYRYELKFLISQHENVLLKQQLKCVMQKDPHSICEEYSYDIRSLYFDDPYSSSYYEKINGEEYRKKYRIRLYNQDTSVLKLECKYKVDNLTYKKSANISLDELKLIEKGDYASIHTNDPFKLQFLQEALNKPLKPSIIVDYRRTAYVYPVSEVRITFDEELRSGRYNRDLLDFEAPTVSMYPPGISVLEVKCNEFIPSHILSILNSIPLLRQAFSKFAACRSIQ